MTLYDIMGGDGPLVRLLDPIGLQRFTQKIDHANSIIEYDVVNQCGLRSTSQSQSEEPSESEEIP